MAFLMWIRRSAVVWEITLHKEQANFLIIFDPGDGELTNADELIIADADSMLVQLLGNSGIVSLWGRLAVVSDLEMSESLKREEKIDRPSSTHP